MKNTLLRLALILVVVPILGLSATRGVTILAQTVAAPCKLAPSTPANFRLTVQTTPAKSYSAGTYSAGSYGGPATTVQNPTPTTARFTWGASTPGNNCVLAGYRLFRSNTVVGTTTATTLTASSLSPSTSYAFHVAAYDTAGHQSSASNIVTFTTPTTSLQ